MDDLPKGCSGTASLTVGEGDTADALGSGDLAVLGTPALVALCEAATVRAVAEHLSAQQTTVGVRIDLEHLVASAPGALVEARATLVAVDGRRLRFEVDAREGDRLIGRGEVHRVVVDRERFLAALHRPGG